MDKKLVLKIKTLGRLHITDGENEFPQEKKRSAQVELLIVYLILNRNANITNPQLIDFLWPDGNADKPEGALRNLIYRARKEMKQFLKKLIVLNLRDEVIIGILKLNVELIMRIC